MGPKYTLVDLKDHIAIAGVVKNSARDILVQKHVKYGFITIPIGKAEYNQSAEEGLKMELLEECGITIEKFNLITKKSYDYDRYGKLVNLILHLFEVSEFSGEIENLEFEKHSEQKFMDLEEIKIQPYLSDATILYLEGLGFFRDAKL